MGLTSESSDDVSNISEMPATSIETSRGKPHKCNFKGCKAAFSRPWRLNAHLDLHLGKKPFACNMEGCDKSYTSSYHLKRHVIASHTEDEPIEKFKCKYEGCQAIFSLKQNQLRHYKRTHESKSCKTCGKSFMKTAALKVHEFYHTGEPLYKCAKCKMGFLKMGSLNRHLRTHKEHLCPIKNCFELFENWSSVRKHLSKHPPDYICFYCKKQYRLKEFLIAHIKKHMTDTLARNQTPLKRFTCFMCSASILGKASLRRHIIRRHQNPVPRKQLSKERAPRKDKGFPKKAMAATLSNILVDPKIEKKLLKGKSVVSTLDKAIKSTQIFESQVVIQELPESIDNILPDLEDTLEIFEPQFVQEVPINQTGIDVPLEVNNDSSVINFNAVLPSVQEIEYYVDF